MPTTECPEQREFLNKIATVSKNDCLADSNSIAVFQLRVQMGLLSGLVP